MGYKTLHTFVAFVFYFYFIFRSSQNVVLEMICDSKYGEEAQKHENTRVRATYRGTEVAYVKMTLARSTMYTQTVKIFVLESAQLKFRFLAREHLVPQVPCTTPECAIRRRLDLLVK